MGRFFYTNTCKGVHITRGELTFETHALGQQDSIW